MNLLVLKLVLSNRQNNLIKINYSVKESEQFISEMMTDAWLNSMVKL